ncbi:MAG: DUF4215 domain-containing protein [Candidatus Peribacteria bacterium]|nr:MAG: DUF4215 domain-containing protein [Candidatus Peribacteria bacterium]
MTENAFCGDGIVNQGNEECDDGNGVNGDGCNNFCKSEGVIIIKIKKNQ